MAPTKKALPPLWIGNDYDLPLRAKSGGVGFDLTGSEIIFIMKLNGATLRKSTADVGSGLTLEAHEDDTGGVKSVIMLSITTDETRNDIAVPGDWAYEVERRIGGKERSLFYGPLPVGLGVNDDA